jgi:hypothetical protein
MTLVADNVRVAYSGAAYVGPTTVTLPTLTTDPWPVGMTDLGWLDESGVTESYEEDTTEIKGWQGGTIVRRMISSSEARFAFTLIETKRDVLELYHKGSKVVANGAEYRLDIYAPRADVRTFGFDVLDGDEHMRIGVPRGEVVERGEITYLSEGAISYPVTITAYPTAGGLVAAKYSPSAAWAP